MKIYIGRFSSNGPFKRQCLYKKYSVRSFPKEAHIHAQAHISREKGKSHEQQRQQVTTRIFKTCSTANNEIAYWRGRQPIWTTPPPALFFVAQWEASNRNSSCYKKCPDKTAAAVTTGERHITNFWVLAKNAALAANFFSRWCGHTLKPPLKC